MGLLKTTDLNGLWDFKADCEIEIKKLAEVNDMMRNLQCQSHGGGPFVCALLIPCASHVPARCRGEKKSRSKCQSVGTASLRALCDEMRGVAKVTSREL